MVAVCSGGSLVFGAYNLYRGNEKFYDTVVVPLSHLLNPETAHNIAVQAAKYGLIPPSQFKDPESLVSVAHLSFCIMSAELLLLELVFTIFISGYQCVEHQI